MEIRKATNDDLPALLALFAAARSFMAAQGNPGQWGNDYPPPELLKEDIAKQGSFVCLHEGKIAASFALLPGPDPDYARLKSGAWRNDSPYFSLHRVAAAGAPKGTGTFVVRWCQAQCPNIRGDTHPANTPMQGLFQKCGFLPVGTLTLPTGSERLAYHYVQPEAAAKPESSNRKSSAF